MATREELNNMTQAVYGEGAFGYNTGFQEILQPGGWDQIDFNNDGDITEVDYYSNASSGITCAAYKDTNGNIVVSFRGSDDSTDWTKNNLPMALLDKVPDQYEYALDFYDQIALENPGANITITGHSLGGALAQSDSNE